MTHQLPANILEDRLRQAPRVVPVVTLSDVNQVEPLLEVCRTSGIQVLEITLRSAAGLAAIRALREQAPDLLIGAGTVNTPERYRLALAAGAQFMVSPGASPALIEYAAGHDVAWLPGVMTPTDILTLASAGFRQLKLFPAELAGGVTFLKAMQAVFPEIQFFPTGGITLANHREYLQLPNVICVGGTWLTPPALVEAGDWARIAALFAQLQ